MRNVAFLFLGIILLVLLLPLACTKQKSVCEECYGVVEALGTPILKWNFDSVKLRYPLARESDWCKLLDEINGQLIKDDNGNELGILRKECPESIQ